MADGEEVHREREMDALLEASMGGEDTAEQQQVDTGDWYRSMTERLEKISCSQNRYTQTTTAITSLHELVEEAIQHRQQGAESAANFFVTMATKQEHLFSAIVDFHGNDLARLEEVISGVSDEVGGAYPTGGYVSREKQLHSLQGHQETLVQCGSELDIILECPLPLEVPSSAEEEESHTPSEVESLHSQAEMLHLKLQSVTETVTNKLRLFEDNLQQERERFLGELVDVEQWLAEVYSVLQREPVRSEMISYTSEQVQNLREEYSDEGTTGGLTLSEQVKIDPDDVSGIEGEEFSIDREVSISGSSLGSDLVDLGVEPEVLDTSVNVELEDDEYKKRVLERVFSPSPSPSPSPLDQPAPYESSVDPSGDPVGEEWAESMEEETDFQTETASVSSGSTLREGPDRSPDPRRERAGTEFSEEEVIPEEVKGGETEEQRERGGKSLADELGELGFEIEQEISDKGVKSEDDLEPEADESGDGESGSDEGSQVSSEGAGLHWVAQLRVLPMHWGRWTMGGEGEGGQTMGGDREGEDDQSSKDPCCYDLDHILQELEAHSSQLQSQNHKIKSAMANINFIINASLPAVAQELQSRLVKVKVQWEPLALRLKQRREQLLFENSQIDALENLHEAMRELEGQPQNNLTHREVEECYSQLMEFFQDVDSFEAQSRDHVSQLESTSQPLLGQREGLLGDGKGARHLLEHVVEGIREGYKLVEDQLKVQKLNLEQWLQEWSAFHSALSLFQDWVGHAEGVASRDCYGNDVKETERYLKNITALKVQLPGEEKKVEELVELGNTLLASVVKSSPAEEEVDRTLTESENRWYNLVEKVESLEGVVQQVLISWRAYCTMYQGARSFISQMTSMVGTEPVESSHGNTALLPTYRTYGDQVRAMQVQYDKLLDYSQQLTENTAVGGRDSIAMETRELRSDWERLKDNVMDSLTLLQREYDDWVHHQLQKMSSLVQQIGEIVARETRYIEEMPLATFLQQDTESLLQEANNLIVCQDQLAQLESECVSLDEVLLERASQQTTRQTLGEEDSPKNTEDHLQLQAARDRYQLISETVVPVINIFFLQLQLLQKIQEGRKVIARAMEAAGDQRQLESLLTDINLSMSDDHFDQLRSDAYDLGTVSEDCELESQEQCGVTLPPYEQLVKINRSLTGEIKALSDESPTAKIRLQLFISWWVEFHSNHGEITKWLEEAESRLDLLEARAESAETPLVSPVELLTDAKELEVEMSEREVLVSALKATSQNIIEEFSHLREEGGEEATEERGVTEQVECVKKRWDEITRRLTTKLTEFEESSSKFNQFITRFTSFCDWLYGVHAQLLDEVCVAIPHKASSDTISHHKAKLAEFREVVEARKNEFDSMCEGGGRGGEWGDHLIPEETQNHLPSDDSRPQSPVATETDEDVDFPFEEHLQQLPYFRTKMRVMTTKWGEVQRLLRDRENQLELSLGNMVVFLEGVEQLLTWIRNQTGLPCLGSRPLAELKSFQIGTDEIAEGMTKQSPGRLGLLRTAENLIGQMSGPNAAKITEKVEEIKEKWEELEITVETQKKCVGDLIDRVEVLLVRVGECEGVLEEGEVKMVECGLIGADLDRLVQQQEILDALDGELLTKKKIPEELAAEAMNIISDCLEGSGGDLMARVGGLQNRFDKLSESCYESRELCEEATAAMQSYKVSEDEFSKWLTTTCQKLEERAAVKRPIGTIHNETEEFVDFMKEMEQHTEQYGKLRSHGNTLAAKYKPSDTLDEMMSSLHHRWEDFVCKLCGHYDKLHSLAVRWDAYECDVTNLLNWIMSEANRFSGEVTVQGDKGVEDHIDSCKVFSETLESKKEKVSEIKALAEELREEDGEKSNGTCDVDSRWNDVNQHWSSLCKLLLETLIRLEATYSEVQHVLLIRGDEFDWLEHREREAADQHCCHGDVGRVEEEIVRQQQLLSEVEGHTNESEFIRETVEFLLEHTQLAKREDIKEKASEFSRRYDDLLNSLKSYVGNLQASVPVWREFNAVSQELWEWLDHTHVQLTSDLTRPGNAIVTETSLRNVELLLEELAGHQGTLHTLTTLTSSLSQLTPPGDKEYVCGVRDQLVSRTADLEEQTQDRTDTLAQRLKSWQVFPVAEAQAVQAFLQEVQMAMGGNGENGESGEEEGEEEVQDMNSDQLLEQLKKLEELQSLQLSNREKLSTIDQAMVSADVQAALEKNPDISKERSNLLQGWASVSEALTQRITAIKMRAEMVGKVEGALVRVCECVREFREEVDRPLPSSAQLENCHGNITEQQTSLQNKCKAELTGLENVLGQYSASPELEIPAGIMDRASTAREDFKVVTGKAEQKVELMATQLETWAELKSLLPHLFSWVRGAMSELTCLKKIPEFSTEFSSFETRMDDLRDKLAENTEPVHRLQTLAELHITPDDQGTQNMRKKFSRIVENWRALNEGMETLAVAMVPWKELTDQFDELGEWLDRLREQARRDLSDLEQEEDDYCIDFSDYVIRLKDHLLKMEQQAGGLVKLTNQRAELLSHDICNKHQPAHDLNQQISELEDMWAGQEQLLRHTLSDVEDKQTRWKEKAVSSIRYVNSLTADLSSRDEAVYAKERELEQQRNEITELKRRLRSQPLSPPPVQRPLSSFFKCLVAFLFLLLIVFGFLTVVFHDLGPHLDLSPLLFQLSHSSFTPI